MSVKIDRKQFDKLLKDLDTSVDKTWVSTYEKFRSLTPVKSGNARRRTKLQGDKIVADYAYAERLDTGWSAQAPQGMSKQTLDYFEKTLIRKWDSL